MCKQFARPGNNTLQFVEYEQNAVLIAQIAQTFQALIRNGPNAALALHGLDDNRGDLIGNCGVQSVMIAKL